MMDDQELLELAAKANNSPNIKLKNFGAWIDEERERYWNPLADDGDALRLAVKLELLSGPDFWREMSVQCAMAALRGEKQDPYATTRRSIVLAAAEIGKAMPHMPDSNHRPLGDGA